MGIRSFIKRNILRKEDDGPSEEDDAVTLHSLLQSPDSAGLMESPSSEAGDPPANQQSGMHDDNRLGRKKKKAKLSPSTNVDEAEKSGAYEDTNKKIQRMKSGGMTEEEKMAFLNNAVSVLDYACHIVCVTQRLNSRPVYRKRTVDSNFAQAKTERTPDSPDDSRDGECKHRRQQED